MYIRILDSYFNRTQVPKSPTTVIQEIITPNYLKSVHCTICCSLTTGTTSATIENQKLLYHHF